MNVIKKICVAVGVVLAVILAGVPGGVELESISLMTGWLMILACSCGIATCFIVYYSLNNENNKNKLISKKNNGNMMRFYKK